uniref:Uncharacterized protein n=1 Tax=Arundo donax TaxID=35708 RepID=A0A0A8ZQG5_ARUDO
MLRYSPTKALM